MFPGLRPTASNMTKLLPVSDLHLNYHADGGATLTDLLCAEALAQDATLVIAGDVAETDLESCLLRFAATGASIVYVLGNHDCWGRTLKASAALARRVAQKHNNFHFLNRSAVDIGGVRIHGCTGWYPQSVEREFLGFIDLREVQDSEDIYIEAEQALTYLLANVRPGDVVVTHHLPHFRSISSQYHGLPSNAFFLNEQFAQVITERKPNLWIHGHTHSQRLYQEQDTTVICNPFGYLKHEPLVQMVFRHDLVIDVEPLSEEPVA